MELVDYNDAILSSWNNAIKKSLSPNICKPQKNIGEGELQFLLKSNSELITTFQDHANHFLHLNFHDFLFLLFNREIILLSISGNKKNVAKLAKIGIQPGISFAEDSVGLTSTSLSSFLDKPICLEPDKHYCKLLRSYYCCSSPLKISGYPVGYLNILTTSAEQYKQSKLVIDLLGNSIMNKLHLTQCRKCKSKLSEPQLMILSLAANGKTESEIAQILNYSKQTIKYHKRRIFEKLDVSNTCSAITKLYRYNNSECQYK